MKDILQKWMKERLGLLIEMEKLDYYMRDGTVFVRILKHYDAINTKSINLHPCHDDYTCRVNLTQLKIWFKLLGIDFSDEIIQDIIDGKTSSCVRILYQLYLLFENTNSLHFIPQQKERFVKKHSKKFKVSLSDVQDTSSYKNENLYKFSNRILENNDVIKWYGDKHCKKNKTDMKSSFLVPINGAVNKKSTTDGKYRSKRKTRYEEDVYYVRNVLSRCIGTENISEHESFCNINYLNDCTSGSNMAGSTRRSRPDSNIHYCGHFLPPISTKGNSDIISPCSSTTYSVEKYLKQLKCVVKSSFKKRCMSKHFCDVILTDVWDIVLSNEEEDFKKIIARRLLKQSLFERKMSMKYFQSMKQINVQKQSYVEIQKRMKSKQSSDCEMECMVGDVCEKNEKEKLVIYQDYLLYYKDERKRTVELHRRLYAEKLKLRFQKHYALCLQTIEDIIDLAIKKSEFKATYEMDVPNRLWAQMVCLFHHGIPVFDVDNISIDIDNSAIVTDPVEISRQAVLNEWDLNNYLFVQNEWDNLFDGDHSNPFYSNYTKHLDNQLVIGFVVHRLLQTKYPCQPPPKPVDIHKYPLRVILNEMFDEEAIIKLKSLLANTKILVVDVNSAVNFCLQCYKDEFGSENISFYDKNHLKVSLTKSDSNKLASTNNGTEATKDNIEQFKDEITQTSFSSVDEVNDTFPFGEAAKLGGELLDNMLLGNELATDLIVKIVLEFIRTHSNKINGWVLVNFPSTLFQASVMEFALTSKKFPYHLEDDTASLFDSDGIPGKESKDVKDNLSINDEVIVRRSRIVQNPSECGGEDVFKTYFTKFITAVKGESMSSTTGEGYPLGEEFDSLQLRSDSTLLLEHPEREGVPAINEFYREQFISYDFIYELFDLNALKQLARLILCEDSEDELLETASAELFGEDVLDALAEYNDDGSVGRSEITQTRSVKNLLPLLEQNDGVSSGDEVYCPDNICSLLSKRNTISKPRDRNWTYCSGPIPDGMAIGLATYWESLETFFLNNLREVFFLSRNTDYSLIPYIHYVTEIMRSCLNQKDDRQLKVIEFLDSYNLIHQGLRSDEEMKLELHLRVSELKEQLVDLCANKRDAAEEMRRTLINQNWTYLQMVAIGNCFISMLQIEADRCLRTLDLLKDFFCAMVGIFKPDPLIEKDLKLSKINLVVEEDSKESVIGSEIIEKMLDNDDAESLPNPVCIVIENKATELSSEIVSLKSVIDSLIATEETNALKIQKDLFNKKLNSLKEEKKPKQSAKSKNKSNSKDAELQKELQAKADLKIEADQKEIDIKMMFLEWSRSVKGEADRALYRIEMIKKKALLDIMEIENVMKDTFCDFNNKILSNFNLECQCIDMLCTLFRLAIEEKTAINADIAFVQDRLYVSKRVIEKTESVIKLPLALDEMLFEETFTVKQLEELRQRLMVIAPKGFICQETFVNFFQSLIAQGTKGSFKLVPNLWRKLHPDELLLFFRKVFGNAGIVEWRIFLISCLDLPFPITEDLIDAKLQFLRLDPLETETVSYDDYMSTTLWFHRELPETPLHALHNILAKEYLFTLFKVEGENLINYMALLLAFCKDEDVKVGFSKGLSLLYGRCVIIYEKDLFLEKILTDHILTSFKIVDQILKEIIEDIILTSEGFLVKDSSEFRYREFSILADTDSDSESSSETNNFDCVLTESMYNQFFRRHLALQWTSRVPYVIISTLLSIIFFPAYMSYYIAKEYLNLFEEVRSKVTLLQDSGIDYVYTPTFLESWRLDKVLLSNTNRFKALSLPSVIKEIISDRK